MKKISNLQVTESALLETSTSRSLSPTLMRNITSSSATNNNGSRSPPSSPSHAFRSSFRKKKASHDKAKELPAAARCLLDVYCTHYRITKVTSSIMFLSCMNDQRSNGLLRMEDDFFLNEVCYHVCID